MELMAFPVFKVIVGNGPADLPPTPKVFRRLANKCRAGHAVCDAFKISAQHAKNHALILTKKPSTFFLGRSSE